MEAHSSSILSRLPTSYASPGLPVRVVGAASDLLTAAGAPYGCVAEEDDGPMAPKAPGAAGLEHEDCDEPTVAAVLATSGVPGQWVDEDEETDDEEEEEESDGGAGVEDPNAICPASGVGTLAPRSAWWLSSSAASLAASLWRPDAALGGVRPSPVLLSARLISVSIDSSCSLATLGVDAAGWSGLESGGDRGERMGDPPGTLPLEEDEALRVTTSFHELATDSLVARWCWSLGDPLLSLFLSNRFSNMGCTSPHGGSSSACASSPPVRLRSAASASKMRRTSSSSAVAPPPPPPPAAAAAGCGCACPPPALLLTLLEELTALHPLPVPLALPPAPPLAPLPSAQTVEEVTTLEPGSKPSCGVTVLATGGLGA